MSFCFYFMLLFIEIFSEFDKYQLSLVTTRKPPPIPRPKEEPTYWEFKDNLEPGKTYSVIVKTVSGKVTSWPVTAEVTLSKCYNIYKMMHVDVIISFAIDRIWTKMIFFRTSSR